MSIFALNPAKRAFTSQGVLFDPIHCSGTCHKLIYYQTRHCTMTDGHQLPDRGPHEGPYCQNDSRQYLDGMIGCLVSSLRWSYPAPSSVHQPDKTLSYLSLKFLKLLTREKEITMSAMAFSRVVLSNLLMSCFALQKPH